MKKFLSLFLALMFVISLAACDGDLTDITLTDATTTEEATTTQVTTIETTTGDTTTDISTTEDTTAPVLSGVQDQEVLLNSTYNPLDGVTATDNVDGDISDQIVVSSTALLESGLLDTSKTGEFLVKYSIADSAGLKSEQYSEVTVYVDESLFGDEMIHNGDFSLGAAVWTVGLNEGGAGTFDVVEEGDNSVGALEVTTPGWSATFPRLDSNVAEFENGKTYLVSFKAKALDARPIKVQVGQLFDTAPWFEDYKEFQIEIFDLTTEWDTYEFKFTMNQPEADGTLLEGQLLFEHGGAIEGEVTVPEENYTTTVYYDDVLIEESTPDPDEEKPVLTGVENTTVELGATFDPLAGVTAIDVVDGIITLDETNYVSDVDTSVAGEYTVTYTVSDEAGNEETAIRTVTVVELVFTPTTEIVDGTFTTTTEIVAEVQDSENTDITDPEIWYHYLADWDGAVATASVVNEAAVFDITSVGGHPWGLMLKQRGITLVQGETYKLSFTASSTADRDIIATVGAVYSETFNITSTPTTFSFMFTYEEADTLDAKLEFLLGNTPNFVASVVTIDDVELSQLEQDELVVNSEFDNIGWDSYDHADAGAAMTIEVVDGELVADVTNVGTEFWNNQIFQDGVTLVPGTTYTLTFDAKASVARDMSFVLIADVDNRETFNLTTTMETYTYTFTYDGTATTGKLDFELGNISAASVAAVVTLDNIVMTDGTTPAEIVNNDFEEVIGWGVYSHDEASTISQVDGELVVNVASTGANNYDVQVFQDDIALVEGESYTMVFSAKADVARDIVYKIMTPGYNVREEQTVSLTTEMQTFEFTFTYDGTDPLGQINFELGAVDGATAGTVTFGSVLFFRNYNVVPEVPVEETWTAYGDMTVTETVDGLELTYGAIPTNWWEYNLQGSLPEFDGTKENIVFTFTGELDQVYAFKIEGGGISKEVEVTATGSSQELVIDLSEFTEAERDGLNLVVIFVKTVGATGTLLVEGWDYLIPQWIAYGDMTVTDTVDGLELTYGAIPTNWWEYNLQGTIVDFDATKESIVFTFTGELDQVYAFKIEGGGISKEVEVTATGSLQELVIDLSEFTEAERDGLNLIVIFAKTVGATGTLLIEGWEYVIPQWIAYGDMTVTETVDGLELTYGPTPTNWWDHNLQGTIADFDGTKESIVFTFTGELNQVYVFKIEGGGLAKEVDVTATGSSQELVIDLSEFTEVERDGLNLIVIFSKTEDATGTLLIEGWDYVQPTT